MNDAGVSRTYGYDARGNVTSNGKHSFYYDLSDQPTGVSGVGSYLYDGNQKRGRSIITENNVTKTTYSVYGLGGQLLYTDKDTTSVTGNKRTDYIRAAGQTIARIENSTVKYPHNDLLGSPVSATTSTGAVEWREQYTPYGEKRLDPTQNKDNVGFTGHVQDDITGLTYMQARYYDPAIGRFLSIDPVGFNAKIPSSFNRYAYANNNPYKYVDPDGEFAILFYLGVSVAIVVSAYVINDKLNEISDILTDYSNGNNDSLLDTGLSPVLNESSEGGESSDDGETSEGGETNNDGEFSGGEEVQEDFESLEAAVGSVNPLDDVQKDGETKNSGLVDQGYTEKYSGTDSSGEIQSAFLNPETGRWTGGHRSSRTDNEF